MGDIGESYNAHKQVKKDKKLSNIEYSTKLVNDLFHVTSKNNGVHLVIEHEGLTADFWPSTGKFNIRGKSDYGRGVKNLIDTLKRGNI